MSVFYYNFKNKPGLYDLLKSLDPTKLWRIKIDEYNEKTRLQEEKAHAMLGDIAKQAKHLNKTFDVDGWKRLTISQFSIDCIQNDVPRLKDYWQNNRVELVPSLDGGTLVAFGQQSRSMPRYVYAGWIEWLYAYGINNGIEWSDPYKDYNV